MFKWITRLTQRGQDSLNSMRKAVPPVKKPEHQRIIKVLRSLAKDDARKRQLQLTRYKEAINKAVQPRGEEAPPSQSKPEAPSQAPLISFRARVPFSLPENAKKILENLKGQYPGSKIIPSRNSLGEQVIALKISDAETLKIGKVQMAVNKDVKRINIRNQGVTIQVDKEKENELLVFKFRYPSTPSRVSSLQTANQADLNHRLRFAKKMDKLRSSEKKEDQGNER